MNQPKNNPQNNQPRKTQFLEADDQIIVEKKKELTPEERKKIARKQKIRYVLKVSLVMFIFSALLFGFGLLWQGEVTLMTIGDALWLVFALLFAFGWMLFVYNRNIFSPLIHGTKTFVLMFVGKRPKKDYFNYMKSIEENPIPGKYVLIFFISAAVVLIPAIIIMLILLNQ